MQVKLIGTGSGKTQLSRFHTSLLVTDKNTNLLIDAGDGISKALLKSGIDYNTIDFVFITHTHADHFTGLPSLLTQIKMNGREKPLTLFLHNSAIKFFNDFLNFSFLFPETFSFELNITGYNFNEQIQLNNSFSIIPILNKHITNKYNVKGLDESKFVSSSLYVKSENTSFYYTSDIADLEDLKLSEKFEHDFLFSETTHLPFEIIIEFIKNAKIKLAFLLHINDNDEIIEKYQTLSDELKRKVLLTYDGMNINLS